MAGFYLALGNIEGNRIAKAGKFFEFFPEDEHRELFSAGYFSCVTVSQNDPFLFDSAYDEVTGVKVFCSGRIAWDSDQWSYARSLNQYNGGLSNKLILDQYLSKGITGVYRHNGSAILLIWDARTLELHLLTDHFGYYPAYLYAAQNI